MHPYIAVSLTSVGLRCPQSGVGFYPHSIGCPTAPQKSEAVGDPKALARTSGLMLLILVEVRGPIWITSFVTQDANQLQCLVKHATLRLNFIEPS